MPQPDLSPAFAAADETAKRAQRSHLRAVRIELILLVAASLVVVFLPEGPDVDLGGVAIASIFVLALAVRLHRASHRPESAWYRARAAAESIKTSAWRYAVGGKPFDIGVDEYTVDRSFVDRLSEILEEIREVTLVYQDTRPNQVTEWMTTTRARPLTERKAIYLGQRIEDQFAWYSLKAETNRRQASIWSLGLMALEVLGFVLGLAVAVRVPLTGQHALIGLATTLVAVGAAWVQTRQHETLASAYAIAAQELAAIATLIEHVTDEEEWAEFVSAAEEAISREHTLWRSTRPR